MLSMKQARSMDGIPTRPETYNPISSGRTKNTSPQEAADLHTTISYPTNTNLELPRCDPFFIRRMDNLTLGEILKRYAIASSPTVTIFGLPIWDPIFNKKIENLTLEETLKIRALIPPPVITSFDQSTSFNIPPSSSCSNVSVTPRTGVKSSFENFSNENDQGLNVYIQGDQRGHTLINPVNDEDFTSRQTLLELSLLSPMAQQKYSTANYLSYPPTPINNLSTFPSTAPSGQFWNNSNIIN